MKNTLSTALKRGFTLIELMIVIVILGFLAAALIPTLTGAQARARDTERTMELDRIAGVLETIVIQDGVAPGVLGEAYCLTEDDDVVWPLINAEFDDANAIIPPSGDSLTIDAVPCVDGYVYFPLLKNGAQRGFGLVAQVESASNANLLSTSIDDATEIAATTTVDNIETMISGTANGDILDAAAEEAILVIVR